MKEILTFVVLLILGALRYFEYRHREGKVALCETCAYDGYCRDKNEKNVADDRSDDGGSTIK